MDQIARKVHIQVEKSRKSSNNKHKLTNNINWKKNKKFVKELAKIHGHKPYKNYKKLLKSYDPILNDNELVNALSDPDDKIGRNEKIIDDLWKRIWLKEDKISAILAERSKDKKDTIHGIQEQKKPLAIIMKNLREEDDIDIFFKSIAMTVKKMTPQAIKKAKLKTLMLITEVDVKYSTC